MPAPRNWTYEKLIARTIESPKGCFEWQGARALDRGSGGYGQVRMLDRQIAVHRLVWKLTHGDPGDLCVCHHCDNPPCIRKEHLFLGTHADNMRDMGNKGRGGNSSVTPEMVREIRERCAREKYAEIAASLGVTYDAVRQIAGGNCWKHIHGGKAAEKVSKRKLTYETADAIRANVDGLSQRKLAAKYGVSKSSIAFVQKGVTWRHG